MLDTKYLCKKPLENHFSSNKEDFSDEKMGKISWGVKEIPPLGG